MQCRRLRYQNHDYIQSLQEMLALAERFFDETPDTIAVNSTPQVLFRNSEPQAGNLLLIGGGAPAEVETAATAASS